MDKEHARKKSDETDARKTTTGEQALPQPERQSQHATVLAQGPVLGSLFCGCFGVGVEVSGLGRQLCASMGEAQSFAPLCCAPQTGLSSHSCDMQF